MVEEKEEETAVDSVPCASSIPPPIRFRGGGPPIREREPTANQRAVPEGDAGGGTNNTEKCYKCNRPGHFARDCKEEEDHCYRCDGVGHIAKDCEHSSDERLQERCNLKGHMARNCPKCYMCGGFGHISRQCEMVA
ncbi:CCHC-type zinc finger protein [Portunus trituberculatus]|uniref:CCHC-type zinc finger protein n=1 Tax=Portunus trituberculatus TaxID=210409 RepID=A0A5B7DJV0_PORTR|nr:CCHC-type zinc finger protein [Portunus trituberculatus]